MPPTPPATKFLTEEVLPLTSSASFLASSDGEVEAEDDDDEEDDDGRAGEPVGGAGFWPITLGSGEAGVPRVVAAGRIVSPPRRQRRVRC